MEVKKPRAFCWGMEMKELRLSRIWLVDGEQLGEFWWLDVLEWLGEL